MLREKWDPHATPDSVREKALKPLTLTELDGVERDLNKMGTPPDNVLRRMIAEIRRVRASKPKPKKPKKAPL